MKKKKIVYVLLSILLLGALALLSLWIIKTNTKNLKVFYKVSHFLKELNYMP